MSPYIRKPITPDHIRTDTIDLTHKPDRWLRAHGYIKPMEYNTVEKELMRAGL